MSEGRFQSVQQLIETSLSPPVEQSFAADFDQVSSFGRSARFPDNIACCGNRNLKVSGDTRVALSVHTWLHFYVWPSQTLFCLCLVLWRFNFDLTLKTWNIYFRDIYWVILKLNLIIQIKNIQFEYLVLFQVLNLARLTFLQLHLTWFRLRFDLISLTDLLFVWPTSCCMFPVFTLLGLGTTASS